MANPVAMSAPIQRRYIANTSLKRLYLQWFERCRPYLTMPYDVIRLDYAEMANLLYIQLLMTFVPGNLPRSTEGCRRGGHSL
jgi:hypothetical protein